ncbi:hypothetical protein SODALDRAFT_326285 [Sodiomyces alkalinus F11]|uniref:Uncharacterized protein n=1 Tax=Sodiomyces alkalinus (strain CBS 110278 / VKM F-3762 / F11) TaxID=1314773 RepID=A0A3N2Q5Z5_SODAK|nr:hypothetical protein SODALDRAFT_326285 [Sodiomyces alkalinus F11]ROT42126.1 hypothetical protein SODALDRAFT_326285 [Sodiomyces alkalinus F11]
MADDPVQLTDDIGYPGYPYPTPTTSVSHGADLHVFRDFVFHASATQQIWRGFLIGCGLGLFVALFFCFWAPCVQYGACGALSRFLFPHRGDALDQQQREADERQRIVSELPTPENDRPRGQSYEEDPMVRDQSVQRSRFVDRQTLMLLSTGRL